MTIRRWRRRPPYDPVCPPPGRLDVAASIFFENFLSPSNFYGNRDFARFLRDLIQLLTNRYP
jgi:hypothetical protein